MNGIAASATTRGAMSNAAIGRVSPLASLSGALVCASVGRHVLAPRIKRPRALLGHLQVILAREPRRFGPWHADVKRLTIDFPRTGGMITVQAHK